jgi:hypothetical protein
MQKVKAAKDNVKMLEEKQKYLYPQYNESYINSKEEATASKPP